MKNGEKFKEELISLLAKYNAEIEAITDSDSNGYAYRTYIEITLSPIHFKGIENSGQHYEVLDMGKIIKQ